MSQPPSPPPAVTLDPTQSAIPPCAGCGYPLNGLPSTGLCPECGRPYNQSTLHFDGYGRGIHCTTQTAKPIPLTLILAFCLYRLVSALSPPHPHPGKVFFWSFFTLFPIIAVARRYFISNRPPLTLHLGPDGCQLLTNRATIPFLYDGIVPRTGLEIAFITILAAISLARGVSPMDFIPTAVVIGIIAITRQQRRAAWKSLDPAAAANPDYWPAVTQPMPWHFARRVELRWVSNTRCRIIVTSALPNRYASHAAADVEVNCNPAQAADARARINQWAGGNVAIRTAG